MKHQNEALPTVGEIARRLDVPLHRVEYAIRARGIEPVGWAGNARVFGPEAVDQIATWFETLEKVKRGLMPLHRR